MSAGDGADGGPFAGTAWYYARYRPGYPPIVLDDLIDRLSLDGSGRLLDLGCGTGQLTLPLAAYVGHAIGMDPEPGMLAEADRCARERSIANVAWRQGSSADLTADLGRFRVVTMGRCFHWMDRARVLATLDERVDDGGSLVLANDSNLILPSTPWQRAVAETQRRFLPPEDRRDPAPAAGDDLTHEQVLASSPFPRVNRRVYAYSRRWTIDQIIGYFYSTSLPLRRWLGDRRPAFEEAVADVLLAIDPSGDFTEPVALEVLVATRD